MYIMSGIMSFNFKSLLKKWKAQGISYGIIISFYTLVSGCDPSETESVSLRGRNQGRPYCIKGVWYYPQNHYRLQEEGIASYYGINDGEHKGPDAMGGIYNMYKMTAAHKTLPLPAVVQVHNINNGRHALVAVTDRGPFVEGRIIDVSVQAAKVLGFFGTGTAPVRIQALEKESKILAQLAKTISLKSTNLSDLLPKVHEVCQNHQAVSTSSLLVSSTLSCKPLTQMSKIQSLKPQKSIAQSSTQLPRQVRKFYVSIHSLSFDEVMWIRVQSSAFRWGHPRVKKATPGGYKPFTTLIGPFLQQNQAQKVLKFFERYNMSPIMLPLIFKGG